MNTQAPKMRAQDSNVGEVEATALDFQTLQLTSNLLQAVDDVLHLIKYLPLHDLASLRHAFTIIFSRVRKASRGQCRNTAELRLLSKKLDQTNSLGDFYLGLLLPRNIVSR